MSTHIRYQRFKPEPKATGIVPRHGKTPNFGSAGTNIYVTNQGGSGDGLLIFHPSFGVAPTLLEKITNGISSPTVVAVGPDHYVYVGNAGTNTLTEYSPNPTSASKPCGTIPNVKNPQALAINNGMVWVGTQNDSAITEYYPPCAGSGATPSSGQNAGSVSSRFSNVDVVNPQSFAFQGNGNITVADPGFGGSGEITTWDFTSTCSQTYCLRRVITDHINGPRAIVYDANNVLWVSNVNSNKVTAYAPDATTLDGPPALPGVPTGDGYTNGPNGIALDQNGANHFFIMNKASHTVQQVDVANGYVTNYFGGADTVTGVGGYYIGGSGVNGLVVLNVPGSLGTEVYFVGLSVNHVSSYTSALPEEVGGANIDAITPDCLNPPCAHYGKTFSPYTTGVGTPTWIAADGP